MKRKISNKRPLQVSFYLAFSNRWLLLNQLLNEKPHFANCSGRMLDSCGTSGTGETPQERKLTIYLKATIEPFIFKKRSKKTVSGNRQKKGGYEHEKGGSGYRWRFWHWRSDS
jgi:hypothetical protein